MANAPTTFESPVVTDYSTRPTNASSDVTLTDESSTSKILIRAGSETAAAQQLGVPFGSARQSGTVLVSGQRPSEWLILGSAEETDAFVAALDLTGHVSVVDHTHSRALFKLSGVGSKGTLEKICGLDWDDAITPDGAVVSASVAKANCDIVRFDADEPGYLLACDRSFGQYLFDAILDAGDEFGINVG